MNKLISVIIPYYKKRQYIKATLNSVFNQSYKNLEIIIIYDDKDKKDLKYLQSITVKEKRIKFVVNLKNIGVGKSRNKGMKICKGEYIAFIDADDIWHKKKIESQVNFMIKKKILISHTDYKIVNNGLLNSKIRKARNFETVNDLLYSCDIGLSTVIISKKILKKVKFPSLKTKEDFVFWLNHLKLGNKIFSFNRCLTYWYKTKGSLSSDLLQKIFDGYKVYRNYMNYSVIKSLIYLFILSTNYLLKNF